MEIKLILDLEENFKINIIKICRGLKDVIFIKINEVIIKRNNWICLRY